MFKRASDGRTFRTDERLGGGGEGAVYTLQGNHKLVAKVYLHPTPDRRRKLEAMIANPPADPTVNDPAYNYHPTIAWPVDILLDDSGNFAGFLMPRVVGKKVYELEWISGALNRHSKGIAGITYKFLLRVAGNLSAAISQLHRRDYVLGDIKGQNVLVDGRGLVTIIDCDSFQVRNATSKEIFRTNVATEELLPPELYPHHKSGSLDTVDRLKESDLFTLALVLWGILRNAQHPYSIDYRHLPGDPPEYADLIANGGYPYGPTPKYQPSPAVWDQRMLSDRLIRLFDVCFTQGVRDPKMRPPAAKWAEVLMAEEKLVIQCSHNERHFYHPHLSKCCWCELYATMGYDAYPSPADEVAWLRLGPVRPSVSGGSKLKTSPKLKRGGITAPAVPPIPAAQLHPPGIAPGVKNAGGTGLQQRVRGTRAPGSSGTAPPRSRARVLSSAKGEQSPIKLLTSFLTLAGAVTLFHSIQPAPHVLVVVLSALGFLLSVVGGRLLSSARKTTTGALTFLGYLLALLHSVYFSVSIVALNR